MQESTTGQGKDIDSNEYLAKSRELILGRNRWFDADGSLIDRIEGKSNGNRLVDSAGSNHGAEGYKVFIVPTLVRSDGIDVVGHNKKNCRDQPVPLAIVGIGKPHDRDGNVAKGKSHVAEDRAAIGPEAAELIVHIVSRHGGDTAAHLEKAPDEAQQVEKVLAGASPDVSQCVSFDKEKVGDVKSVDHKESEMTRHEIDRSPVAPQFQIVDDVVIGRGFEEADVGCHSDSFFSAGQCCGTRAKRT